MDKASSALKRLLIVTLAVVWAPLPVLATGTVESESTSGLQPLVIGMMPAVDSIPLIVAESEGYFADEGLTVTLELFRDQLYREASLQSDRIDATISDLVNAIRSWGNGADYRALVSTQGLFAFLSAPDAAVASLDTWPEPGEVIETGVIEDSVIFYTAERMLEAANTDPTRVRIIPTLQIPVRLELLLAGELEAAVLPEPVARLAEGGGANPIIDSSVLEETAGILIATGTAIESKRAELSALLRAYDRAVEAVNADPDAYRQIIVEAAGFPPPVAGSMRIPTFRTAAVPTEELVSDVAGWMLDRGLISQLPEYEAIVLDLTN